MCKYNYQHYLDAVLWSYWIGIRHLNFHLARGFVSGIPAFQRGLSRYKELFKTATHYSFLFRNGCYSKIVRELAYGISDVRYIYFNNFSNYWISCLFQPCLLDGLFTFRIDKKSISKLAEIIMKHSCVISQ